MWHSSTVKLCLCRMTSFSLYLYLYLSACKPKGKSSRNCKFTLFKTQCMRWNEIIPRGKGTTQRHAPSYHREQAGPTLGTNFRGSWKRFVPLGYAGVLSDGARSANVSGRFRPWGVALMNVHLSDWVQDYWQTCPLETTAELVARY